MCDCEEDAKQSNTNEHHVFVNVCVCRKVLADESAAHTESDEGKSIQTHSSSAFSVG